MTAQGPDQLIRTKLRPAFIRSGLVSRPRLQQRILEGLCGPLTLITAPAGFGKTTLVASSISGCGMPVAWLSLDRNDNRTGRFLKYLVASLKSADQSVGDEATQLLVASSEAQEEAILTSVINDLDTLGSDLALVLDDYQFINDQAVHEALAFLLEHCPGNFHVLIASRSDPPLPLPRLRARAQTIELRAADLRFTSAEAAEFLNEVMGIHLDSSSVEQLEERTEGWIAGLQMAALSVRDREDVRGFIEDFSGTHRYILDYLLEEVLVVQPLAVQQFLLCTSILERLNAPLCDALLADPEAGELLSHERSADGFRAASSSQNTLDMLERDNVFLVALDDERIWYRYHHLFADLLRARLEQLYPGLSRRLHLRAAAWLEQAGMAVEAINHSLSAGEYEGAARLVEDNTTRLLAQGELNALMSWIQTLPAELRLTRPWLCIHEAYVLLFAGRTSEVPPLLDQAEASLAGVVEDQALRGAIAAVRAFSASVLVQTAAALSYVEQASKLLSPGDLFNRSLVAWALGYALHSQGRLGEARSAFEEQIRLSRRMQNSAALMIGITALARVLAGQGEHLQARALLEEALTEARRKNFQNRAYLARVETHLAAILCEHNELAAAHRMLTDALSHAHFWLNANHRASIYVYLTRVLLAEGDLQGARAAIAEVDHIRRSAPLSEWLRRSLEVDVVRAWLSLQMIDPCPEHDNPLAEQYRLILRSWRSELMGALESTDVPLSQFIEQALLTMAYVSLMSDEVEEALSVAERLTRKSKSVGHIDTAVQSLAVTASALQRRHARSSAPALAALGEALMLAKPGGYIRVFLTHGQPMQALLSQWLAGAEVGPIRDYAARLLSQFDAEAEKGASAKPKGSALGVLIEPLTPRELEVLRLMSLGRTNLEISQHLIVAPGTIKAHAARIYRKLNASNRTEAVARARQLGIIQ